MRALHSVGMPALLGGRSIQNLGRLGRTGGHFFWNIPPERDLKESDDRHRRILVRPHGCPLVRVAFFLRRGIAVFLFFSNRTGLAGSVLISLLLSAILLYACSA